MPHDVIPREYEGWWRILTTSTSAAGAAAHAPLRGGRAAIAQPVQPLVAECHRVDGTATAVTCRAIERAREGWQVKGQLALGLAPTHAEADRGPGTSSKRAAARRTGTRSA